jgi:hypothetical protein
MTFTFFTWRREIGERCKRQAMSRRLSLRILLFLTAITCSVSVEQVLTSA